VQSTLFVVNKDEWDTKEGCGKSLLLLLLSNLPQWKAYTKEGRAKSMKNALYVYSGMAKGTSGAEATSNSKKIKPIALAIVKLRESEGIRQACS